MSKTVVCVHCGEVIESRDDLVIAGKFLHPLHEECFHQVKGALQYKMAYPVNKQGFWMTLMGVNFILAGIPLAFPGTWQDIRWFFLIWNIPMLLFRGMAYLAYERHLP